MAITTRHKKAAKIIGNSRTEAEALVKANYSPSYARSGQIKRTKGWQEILEKALPDSLIAKRHRELLDKREQHFWYEKKKLNNGKESTKAHSIDLGPDVQAVTKGVDMAYKLKGSYAPDKHVNVNLDLEASPEIKELAKKLNELYGSTGE